jgi:hypothetical protein
MLDREENDMKLFYVMLVLIVMTLTGCGGGDGSNLYLSGSSGDSSGTGTRPEAPTIDSAVAGNAQATVSFAAPVSDGGAPIFVYTVTSEPGGLMATGAASPLTVTGLTNGTAYTFTVTATNAAGTSAPSAASNSVTPVATAPGAPTGVTATFGDAKAVVSFTPPPDGGSPITSYTVTSVPGGITASGTRSPITVTGLTNGTAYTFTVTATNAVGTGVASAASGSVTPVTPRLIGGAIQGIPLIKPVTVSTLAGSGWGSVDGTGTGASFGQVFGITTDGANLYVTEINGTVRKTVIATGVTTTVAGTFNSWNYTDGTGTAARFHTPAGITTDGTNLYVADRQNLNIRKIVIATGVVTTLAGQDTEYPPSTTTIDGIGTAARFGKPIGITTDGTYLYVADTYNATIRKVVIATGEVSTLAGSALGGGFEGADGIGTAARFKQPMGIITDGTYLYVTDQEAGNVRRITLATKAVITLTGAPAGTLAGETLGNVNGTGTVVRFNHPRCLTTDGKDLYLADGDNYRVKKITGVP